MEYRLEEHRYALKIIQNGEEYNKIFTEFCRMLSALSDNDIIELFEKRKEKEKKIKVFQQLLIY